MTEKGCYVYVAAVVIDEKPTKPTKVGISANPWCRVHEMQTGSPHRLTMLHAIWRPTRATALEDERFFHRAYAYARLHGEWFDLEPGDALAGVVEFVDIEAWRQLHDVPLFLHYVRKHLGIHKANAIVRQLEGSQEP